MTKAELIDKLEELKRQISKDFGCSSDRVDELYYSLKYDIENSYDDIKDDRKGINND